MGRLGGLIVLVLLLWGCVTAGPARPVQSTHYSTQGAGFVVDGSAVKYALTYRITKPFPKPVFAVVEFENPASGGSPLVTDVAIDAGAQQLDVQSPPLPGIENNRSYATVLRVYSDSGKSSAIAEHRQNVFFRLPEQVLRAKGIK